MSACSHSDEEHEYLDSTVVEHFPLGDAALPEVRNLISANKEAIFLELELPSGPSWELGDLLAGYEMLFSWGDRYWKARSVLLSDGAPSGYHVVSEFNVLYSDCAVMNAAWLVPDSVGDGKRCELLWQQRVEIPAL